MTSCGPYELLEQVGAGSSGAVYRARHAERGVVALKILLSPPSPRWTEHLRTLGELTNPHLCRLVEVGRDGATPFVAYQFLSGPDLEAARQRYDEGRVPLRTVLRWGIDTLKGLGAIHQAGFLHGDIKPSNLMLDDREQVVVCDFTTLIPLSGPLAHDLRNGTPEYLPSNQDLLRLPQRDLYALGLTISALLLGKLPSGAEQAVPSSQDPLMPAAVDRIVERALGLREPFSSAGDMRHALETLLTGPEPAAVSLSPPTRRVAWEATRRRGPLWPWLLALLMLPLGVWSRGWHPLPPTPTAATALWSGIGVAPEAYRERVLWQVRVLGRPVLGFCAPDPAAGDESARERAEWCAAVLEEAHFQKRPLEFAYRRESADSCDVYLVGQGWPEKFLFRVSPEESKLLDRKAPLVARAWCALLVDTAELARPGSREGEKSASALLLEPWKRRYDTLAGQEGGGADQPARVALWLQALESLDRETHNELMEAYLELPEERKSEP